MKYFGRESEVQRTGPTGSVEMQEEPGQEETHRAQSLHAPESPNRCRVVSTRRIKWLPANRQSVWLQFDEDMSNIIQPTAKRDADSRLWTMTTILFSSCLERFGWIEKRVTKTTPYTMNCRAAQIHQLQQEHQTLKKQ